MSSKVVSTKGTERNAGEKSNEQLHQENAELRTALEAHTQENMLLNEVISTIGSTLKLDEVLGHLVEIVVRAIPCHAAFFFLYDKEKERLVLASTNEHYKKLVGKIEQEEKFQSTMTVPIIAKDRHLIGVISLHTVAPYEFSEQHQTFLINTAALVAGAIENAQLYENTQRKLNILTTLSVMSQTISSGLYLDEMLRSLATLTVQIIEADLCVIMLMDQAKGHLTVRASSPTLNDRALSFQPIEVDRNVWENLRAFSTQGQLPEMSAQAFERLNPLKDSQYKTLLSMPLIAGTDQLGLINCYSAKTRRYTSEDQTLLSTIANQIAMAIRNSHLVDMLAQKNLVKGFFDDLMYGTYDSEGALRQRANFIGCDLTKPHVVVMIEVAHQDQSGDNGNEHSEAAAVSSSRPLPPAETFLQTEEDRLTFYKHISGQIRRRIQDNYPGSIFDERENLLTCLICLSKDPTAARLMSWLRDLAHQMRAEQGVHLSIGTGNQCQGISDYRRGFTEASEALQMGRNLNRDGGITHFNDLGVYRYLYKISRMDDLRDMYHCYQGIQVTVKRRIAQLAWNKNLAPFAGARFFVRAIPVSS